jgi:hypothetical protein
VTWSSLLHLIAAICPSLAAVLTWELLWCNSELSAFAVSLCCVTIGTKFSYSHLWYGNLHVSRFQICHWSYSYHNGIFKSLRMDDRGSIPDKGIASSPALWPIQLLCIQPLSRMWNRLGMKVTAHLQFRGYKCVELSPFAISSQRVFLRLLNEIQAAKQMVSLHHLYGPQFLFWNWSLLGCLRRSPSFIEIKSVNVFTTDHHYTQFWARWIHICTLFP